VQRRAGVAVPEHRRLALIRDADRRELAGPNAAARERLADDGFRVAPNFRGVVLDPARLRIDLLMLALGDGDDSALLVEHHEATARGALIDCADVLAHDACDLTAPPTAASSRGETGMRRHRRSAR
jgi:hypothetical protein